MRRKGSGPPLALLHGFPETHLMWHRVAPALAESFTVICADLRGYGASGKPPSRPDHAPYAKSAMALEYPDRIERLAVLDIIPTGEAFARADARFALAFWPWSLLAQPEPLPERILVAAPEAIIDDALGGWGTSSSVFPP